MQGALRFLVPCASALAVGLVVWSQVSLYQANHLVDEANTSIDAFNASFVEARENFNALFSEANEKSFPANRAMLAPIARQTGELYGKTVEHARAASSKFADASKRPVSDENVAYNQMLSEQFLKTAERCELLREYTLLLVDPSVDSSSTLARKQAEIDQRLAPVMAAEKELEAKAKKIMADHPEKFE